MCIELLKFKKKGSAQASFFLLLSSRDSPPPIPSPPNLLPSQRGRVVCAFVTFNEDVAMIDCVNSMNSSWLKWLRESCGGKRGVSEAAAAAAAAAARAARQAEETAQVRAGLTRGARMPCRVHILLASMCARTEPSPGPL